MAPGRGWPHELSLDVGLCSVAIVAPQQPFQASGIAHTQSLQAADPPVPLFTQLIDGHFFRRAWDPALAAPRAAQPPRGFSIELNSALRTSIAASPVARVDEPLPRDSDADADVVSWYSRFQDGVAL